LETQRKPSKIWKRKLIWNS